MDQKPEREENTGTIERKLVTIISADVAGYSKLMAENEEATLKTFRAHKKIFESIVSLHKGRVFNTAGDAILAEFNSAVEGVRCATEIQSAIRTCNDKLPESRRVQFRIGVNLGDVIVQGSDLMGDGVNIAARVQTAAEPGGVCISGSIYDQIQNKLTLSIESMGEQQYKNIPHPVRTFSIKETEAHKPLPTHKDNLEKTPKRNYAPILFGGALLLVLGGLGFALSRIEWKKKEPAPATEAGATAPVSALPESFDLKYMRPSGSPATLTVAAGETIGQHVEAAVSGAVIEIPPGVYKEHIKIEKNVTLRGLPTADAKVGVRIEFTGSETVDLVQGKLKLENVIVTLTAPDGSASPAAILVRGGLAELYNVGAHASGKDASALSLRAGSAEIANAEFSGMRGLEQTGGNLHCVDCAAIGCREEGFVIFGKVQRSSFQRLTAKKNKLGFAAVAGASVEIEGCTASENNGSGIFVGGTGQATIKNCVLEKNQEQGFITSDTAKSKLTGIQARGNKLSGVAATGSAFVSLSNSQLSDNGEYGVVSTEQGDIKGDNLRLHANRLGEVYKPPR